MMGSILALLFIALVLLAVLAFVARLGKPRLDKMYFLKHWNTIEQEPNTMAALVAADSLLDEALRRAGVKGETMGDRLKHATQLRDINNVWSGHKLRNRLVHETGVTVSQGQKNQALKSFKRALKDLGAL